MRRLRPYQAEFSRDPEKTSQRLGFLNTHGGTLILKRGRSRCRPDGRRDGRHWCYLGDREEFLSTGEDGDPSSILVVQIFGPQSLSLVQSVEVAPVPGSWVDCSQSGLFALMWPLYVTLAKRAVVSVEPNLL